jgi:uncharacterized protein YqhQ
VTVNNRLTDVKTKSKTRLIKSAGFIRLIKLVKDVWKLILRNSIARVFNRHENLFILVLY